MAGLTWFLQGGGDVMSEHCCFIQNWLHTHTHTHSFLRPHTPKRSTNHHTDTALGEGNGSIKNCITSENTHMMIIFNLNPIFLRSFLPCWILYIKFKHHPTSTNWSLFIFSKVLLSLYFFPSFPLIRGPPKHEDLQEVGPPPTSTLTRWNLSHRKWSCAASLLARQIIHRLKNAPFLLPSNVRFLLHLRALPVFSSPHLLFSFKVLQRGMVGETERFPTCVISKWAAFRTKTSCRCGCTGPQIPGNILLRCSLKTCGIPAHSIPTTLLQSFLNGWKAGLFEAFEKWNTDLPYPCTAVLFYCEKSTVKNRGREWNGQFLCWFLRKIRWTNNKITQLMIKCEWLTL